MITCDPLDDEIALSHALRLQRINGLTSAAAVLKIARQKFSIVLPNRGRWVPPGATWLDLLARMTKWDLKYYVDRHSFLPFNLRAAIYGRRSLRASGHDYGCQTPRRDLILCPACVRADLDARGYSHWRRTHQFLGALTCRLHECQLQRVRRSRQHVTSLPHECMNSGEDVQQAAPRYASAISDYQALCERLLTSKLNLSASAALASLGTAARRIRPGLTRHLWWGLAQDRFGESWLLSVPAEAATTARDHYLWPTFGQLTSPSPEFFHAVQPDALVIAALALAPDVQEAFQLIAG